MYIRDGGGKQISRSLFSYPGLPAPRSFASQLCGRRVLRGGCAFEISLSFLFWDQLVTNFALSSNDSPASLQPLIHPFFYRKPSSPNKKATPFYVSGSLVSISDNSAAISRKTDPFSRRVFGPDCKTR